MRDSLGRCMCAVRGGESVADEDVAELGQLGCKGRIVLLLAFMEAKVLEHRELARLQLGDRVEGWLANTVGREGDWRADQLRERVGHGLQRELRRRTALRPAKVGDDDHLGATRGEVTQPRHQTLEPRRIGNFAILHRHVEIGADQRTFAAHVHARRGLEIVEIHDAYFSLRTCRSACLMPTIHTGSQARARNIVLLQQVKAPNQPRKALKN